jgi:hypothetical protein
MDVGNLKNCFSSAKLKLLAFMVAARKSAVFWENSVISIKLIKSFNTGIFNLIFGLLNLNLVMIMLQSNSMKKLMIKQFDGPEIAYVTQSESGTLQVSVLVPELLAEVEELIHKYEGRTLDLLGGEEKVSADGKDGCDLITYKVPPGDPRFLNALGDTVAKDNVLIQGKRVRGWTVEE